MSYHSAFKCFEENVRVLNPRRDSEVLVLWNLSNGLANLVRAVESDISAIRSALHTMANQVDDLQRRR